MPITDYDGQLQTIARNLGEEPALTTTDGLLEAIAKGTENIITEDKLDDYLPLAGGTMTGQLSMNGQALNLGANSSADGRVYNTANYLRLVGGNSTSNGSYIDISSSSSAEKGIWLNASDGNGTTVILAAKPNGTLTWGGNDIAPQTATETASSQDTTLPNNTQKTVHSVTLTKGTWLLLGRVYFASNGNGIRSAWFSSSDNGDAISNQARANATPLQTCWMQVMAIRSISLTTTLYLVASQNSGGNLNASGGVVAFRLSSII